MHLRRQFDIGRKGRDDPMRGFSNTDPKYTELRPGPKAGILTVSSISACRFLCDQTGLVLTFPKDSRQKF